MNKQEDTNRPTEHSEDPVEREIDEPLIVDEEEAEETEQIKAEFEKQVKGEKL